MAHSPEWNASTLACLQGPVAPGPDSPFRHETLLDHGHAAALQIVWDRSLRARTALRKKVAGSRAQRMVRAEKHLERSQEVEEPALVGGYMSTALWWNYNSTSALRRGVRECHVEGNNGRKLT